MSAFKFGNKSLSIRRLKTAPSNKKYQPLPLEEYLCDKLSRKVRECGLAESEPAIRYLVQAGSWERLADPGILEDRKKISFIVMQAYTRIYDIIEQGKEDELRKMMACFFKRLSKSDFLILLGALVKADMKEVVSRMAAYPFIERSPVAEYEFSKYRKNADLMPIQEYGESVCNAITSLGGPDAFAGTSNHRYVLLIHAAFHPSNASRVKAIEKYLWEYPEEEDILELKDVVLHTRHTESAKYIVNRLFAARFLMLPEDSDSSEITLTPLESVGSKKCFLLTIEEGNDEIPPDNSLLVLYSDCLNMRGKEDEVTQHIESLISDQDFSKERMEREVYGPEGPAGRRLLN